MPTLWIVLSVILWPFVLALDLFTRKNRKVSIHARKQERIRKKNRKQDNIALFETQIHKFLTLTFDEIVSETGKPLRELSDTIRTCNRIYMLEAIKEALILNKIDRHLHDKISIEILCIFGSGKDNAHGMLDAFKQHERAMAMLPPDEFSPFKIKGASGFLSWILDGDEEAKKSARKALESWLRYEEFCNNNEEYLKSIG